MRGVPRVVDMTRLGNVAAALSLVLLAGCSGGSAAPEPTDAPLAATSGADVQDTAVDLLPTEATHAWTYRARAHANPLVAGDTLVVVVEARTDELDVVGLDRATGEERWRSPFLTTGKAAGLFLGDLVYESAGGEPYVVFQLAPRGDALAAGRPQPYVALDPATGREVARTRPLRTSYGPVVCDDGRDVCLRVGGESVFSETRWVLGRWRLRREEDRLPDSANTLVEGSEVFAVSGTYDGYVGATAVGRTGRDGWRVPARRVLPGTSWLLSDEEAVVDEESGIVVVQASRLASAQVQRRYDEGRAVALGPGWRQTIGIDAGSGDVLWRHRGSSLACLDLHRPDVAVRCTLSGAVVQRTDWDEPRLRGVSMTVEGFNPRTGETTWSHGLDRRAARTLVLHVRDLDARLDEIADDGRDLLVAPTSGGRSLVSLLDGSSRRLRAKDTLLCRAKVRTTYALDTGAMGPFGSGERFRFVRRPCRPDGTSTDGRVGAAGLMTGAQDVGDRYWSYATRDAVVTYRLP